MLENITRHNDWLLFPVASYSDQVFDSSQRHLLESTFDKDALIALEAVIREQFLALGDHAMVEIEAMPFLFLLIRSGDKHLLALSRSKGEKRSVSEEQLPSNEDSHFIVESPAMKKILEIVKKVSYVDSTILLLGNSGVGKGAIAKLIHNYSSRSEQRFISVNCGAIPESLMEAELFGYAHGSFTGGQKGGKTGLFESANGGTIFLDEIGELALNLQVKLLEVLQENCIRRVGATQTTPIDVRVIAATNQNLLELVGQKKFREDLYYRLNVVPIEIPPLCKRVEDIKGLTHYFLHKYTHKHGVFKVIHPDVEKAFLAYEWPGNVRELENMIERMVITVEEQVISLRHLPAAFQMAAPSFLPVLSEDKLIPLKEAKRLLEKELIYTAYRKFKSTYKAAEALGVDQSTIAKKLKEFRDVEGEGK